MIRGKTWGNLSYGPMKQRSTTTTSFQKGQGRGAEDDTPIAQTANPRGKSKAFESSLNGTARCARLSGGERYARPLRDDALSAINVDVPKNGKAARKQDESTGTTNKHTTG